MVRVTSYTSSYKAGHVKIGFTSVNIMLQNTRGSLINFSISAFEKVNIHDIHVVPGYMLDNT